MRLGASPCRAPAPVVRGAALGNWAAFTRARGDTCGRLFRAIGPGRPQGPPHGRNHRIPARLPRKGQGAYPLPSARWHPRAIAKSIGFGSGSAAARGLRFGASRARGHAVCRLANGAVVRATRGSTRLRGGGGGNARTVIDPERGTDLREERGSGGRNPKGAFGMEQGRTGGGRSGRRETVRNLTRRQVGGW